MQVRGGPKTVVTIYLTSKKAKRCLLICRGSNQVKGKSKSRVSSGRREQSVTAAPRFASRESADELACCIPGSPCKSLSHSLSE